MFISKRAGIGIGITLAAAFGLSVLAVTSSSGFRSVETGKNWLEGQGYTDVTGGESLKRGLNGCGPLVASRDYQATSPDGETGLVSVCLSGFGPRFPAY
ncbi:MAG: hypothetical protein H6867_07595 [Rhodospirillales bacterium]|nr:hypothetical protein [Rhodospirillales bacterium]MCB9995415.1 hypothetical protein [Rhodospirillales bacterium]